MVLTTLSGTSSYSFADRTLTVLYLVYTVPLPIQRNNNSFNNENLCLCGGWNSTVKLFNEILGMVEDKKLLSLEFYIEK